MYIFIDTLKADSVEDFKKLTSENPSFSKWKFIRYQITIKLNTKLTLLLRKNISWHCLSILWRIY